MKSPTRYATWLAAGAAAVLLAACGKTEDAAPMGQPPPQQQQPSDSGAASGAPGTAGETPSAIGEMRQEAQNAGDAIAEKASDMAITAKVNAALAADEKLSALKIDVDTQAGRVALTGTAPDAESRDRATTLARAVEGVVAVDNRLVVERNS